MAALNSESLPAAGYPENPSLVVVRQPRVSLHLPAVHSGTPPPTPAREGTS